MRRRNLMIGLGALTAGGSAAFGTEAFTSVEAERNVDVAIAGDQSSYLALKATDSSNADKYVKVENDDQTLELILDGEGHDAAGVSQDAVTKFNDLFKILNQGSQAVNVYFEDGSDAVTFRSSESSVEGARNSAELGVGEQIVVSLTVDTLNNEVDTDADGTLLDKVTIFAQADDPSPGGEAPVTEFDRIVNSGEVPEGSSEGRYYADIGTALEEATPGDNIGLEEAVTLSNGSGKLALDTDGITVASVDPSSPQTITAGNTSNPASSAPNDSGPAIELSADGVSLQSVDVEIAYNNTQVEGGVELVASGDDTNISDITFERTYGDNNGSPALAVRGSGVTVSDSTFGTNSDPGGPISLQGTDDAEIVGNVIQDTREEGIWGSDLGDAELTISGNSVDSHDTDGSGQREIKLVSQPDSLNGEINLDDQFDTLLADNTVNTVRIAGGDGVIAKESPSASNVYDLDTALDEAGSGGFVRAEAGTYDREAAGDQSVILDSDGLTLRGADGATITATPNQVGGPKDALVSIEANDVTVEELEIISKSGENAAAVAIGRPNNDVNSLTGVTLRNNVIRGKGGGTFGGGFADGLLIENNEFLFDEYNTIFVDLESGDSAEILDNEFKGVADSLNGFFSGGTSAGNLTARGNSVEGSGSAPDIKYGPGASSEVFTSVNGVGSSTSPISNQEAANELLGANDIDKVQVGDVTETS